MKPGSNPRVGNPSDRTFGAMVSVSLVLHLGVMLVPGWRSVLAGGPGERSGDESFVVSLVELREPGSDDPANPPPVPAAQPEPVAQEPETATEPETETDPLVPTPAVRSVETTKPDEPSSFDSVLGGDERTPDRSPGERGSDATGNATGSGEGEQIAFQGPRLEVFRLPIDPKDAEALGVPPEIPVRLLIGIDGKVQKIVILLDLPEPVGEAVEHSLKAMRFSPARRGNEPVVAWFSTTIEYPR